MAEQDAPRPALDAARLRRLQVRYTPGDPAPTLSERRRARKGDPDVLLLLAAWRDTDRDRQWRHQQMVELRCGLWEAADYLDSIRAGAKDALAEKHDAAALHAALYDAEQEARAGRDKLHVLLGEEMVDGSK